MTPEPKSRREFLRTAIRTALLGSVSMVGVVLFRRGKNCVSRGGCGDCNAYTGCALPWREEKR